MPADCPQVAEALPAYRSRVTNGKQLLPGIDGRSPTARRYRDLFEMFAEDLGGMDHISEGQRQLARRGAALSCLCEAAEAEMCTSGKMADVDSYRGSVNVLRRVLVSVGLERKAREINAKPFGLRQSMGLE